jgi:hypothetical protein
MADKGWHRAFDGPIPLPGGGKLVTLCDAATYITSLPKAEQHAPQWQTATELLMLVAERGGDTRMPRIEGAASPHAEIGISAATQARQKLEPNGI